ncbi:MAG TPA: CPBP family intramembrane glutamic endopeptidase [Propionibacteriaceae bacterium]|nr:CPBP family intramembrane glutamic endopeptidase [Propionibacteriaceae bacterium]
MNDTDVEIAWGHGLRALAVRHQMVLFVLLTYLISWSFVIPADGGLIPYGPMIAAFIVLAVARGRGGVAGLWKQMTRWRVGWKWWLLAPGVLIAIHLCALMINIAFGAKIVNTAHVASLPVYLSATVLPLLLLGGQWEEPGWMGYAQRRYQERFIGSVLKATLVVGIIRIIWHTPLLAYGTIPWYDYIFGIFALQIIFTWLYNGAGASVLIAMIAHLFSNVMTATVKPLFSPAGQERYWLIMTAVGFLVALSLLIATRGRLGLKPTNERAVTNAE